VPDFVIGRVEPSDSANTELVQLFSLVEIPTVMALIADICSTVSFVCSVKQITAVISGSRTWERTVKEQVPKSVAIPASEGRPPFLGSRCQYSTVTTCFSPFFTPFFYHT
jgi:hypothetical protein